MGTITGIRGGAIHQTPPPVELSPFKKRVIEICRVAIQALLPFIAGLLCAAILPAIVSAVVLPIVVIGVAFIAAFLYVPDFKPSQKTDETNFEPLSPAPLEEFHWDYQSRVDAPPADAAPRGIYRPGAVMNCWLHTLLQMLRRDERIWGWLRNPPEDRPLEGIERMGLFVRNYEQAILQGQGVVSGNAQGVRKEFAARNPGEISELASRQEDIAAGLDVIMNHPSLSPECFSNLLEITDYREPEFLPKIQGGPRRITPYGNWGLIQVSLAQAQEPQPIQGLVENYFVEEVGDLEVALPGVPEENGEIPFNFYPVERRSFCFETAPEKIWIQVKRFQEVGGRLVKNRSPLRVQEEIRIPTANGYQIYDLDSFASHHGATLRTGHYNGHVGNYFCDDAAITPADRAKRQRDSQGAYLLLYSRRPD